MKVIHILRKPLGGSVAQNILEHGCGALHIDAGRIPSGGEHFRGVIAGRAGGMTEGDEREGAALGMFEGGRGFKATDHAGGRWPANLVLQHLPGCRCTGTKRIKGIGIHGESFAVRRSGVHAEAGGHQTIGRVQPVHGYTEADGKETVAAWECEPGCPVKELDEKAQDTSGTSRFFKQVR